MSLIRAAKKEPPRAYSLPSRVRTAALATEVRFAFHLPTTPNYPREPKCSKSIYRGEHLAVGTIHPRASNEHASPSSGRTRLQLVLYHCNSLQYSRRRRSWGTDMMW